MYPSDQRRPVRLDRRIFRWYVPAIYSITRAQVTAIVNRMLGRSADTAYMDRHTDELRRFSDVEGTHWAYLEATNAHSYDMDNGTEEWTGLL